ncbi:hypothetical protein MMPV_006530 [Pyropia vietnamensis]
MAMASPPSCQAGALSLRRGPPLVGAPDLPVAAARATAAATTATTAATTTTTTSSSTTVAPTFLPPPPLPCCRWLPPLTRAAGGVPTRRRLPPSQPPVRAAWPRRPCGTERGRLWQPTPRANRWVAATAAAHSPAGGDARRGGDGSGGNGSSSPPALWLSPAAAAAASHLAAAPDQATRLARLVELGDRLPPPPPGATTATDGWSSLTPVPGCTAIVRVAVRLVPAVSGRVEGGDSGSSGRGAACVPALVIQAAGEADARLSRGLVALVLAAVNGEGVGVLLGGTGGSRLTATAVAVAAGLDVATAGLRSRINGLGGVVETLIGLVASAVAAAGQVRQEGRGREESGGRASSVIMAALTDATEGGVALPTDAAVDPSAAPGDAPTGSTGASSPHRHPITDGTLWTSRQGTDVAVLLSGGVDSSVALRRLLDAGHSVTPYYLKIWLADELAHLGAACPWEEDIAAASAVASQVGLRLRTLPLQAEYWDRVVTSTVSEARAGRTPNPDVLCNGRIKFGAFYDAVGGGEGMPVSRLVTMHARGEGRRAGGGDLVNGLDGWNADATDGDGGPVRLLQSADAAKDQTYFLSHLTQAQLAKAAFPIGGMPKPAVRAAAAAYGLPNSSRPDSQGICFLGKLKFDAFLGHHLGTRPGPLVEYETGTRLGTHRGYWFYTPGQRRGLGLSGGPWHVVWKGVEENVVYVSRAYGEVAGVGVTFSFGGASWVAARGGGTDGAVGAGAPVADGVVWRAGVKTRHGPRMGVGDVVLSAGGTGGVVTLDARDGGLAPGQYAAFYVDGACLGAGVIEADLGVLVGGAVAPKKLQAHYF